MEIVINKCYGGFSLSNIAIKEYYKLKGKDVFFYEQVGYRFDNNEKYIKVDVNDTGKAFGTLPLFADFGDIIYESPKQNGIWADSRPDNRTDPDLIKVVRMLGEKANGDCASLEIIEIPDGVDYEIDEYDGMESVSEKHRSWY